MGLWLRRFLRMPAFLLTLILVLLVCLGSFGYVEVKEDRPCGIFSQSDSETAHGVVAYLVEQGFVECGCYEELREMVRTGKADCGLVLPGDFEEKLQRGKTRGCADLLTSSRSSRENTYAMIAMVGIFRAYAPYLASDVAGTLGYEADPETMAAYMEEYYGIVPQLAFRITSVEGETLPEQASTNLPVGIMAVCGFLAMGFFSIGVVAANTRQTSARFSKLQRMFSVIMPQTMSMALLLGCVTALGGYLGSRIWGLNVPGLIPGVFGYYLFLGWLCSLIVLLPLGDHLRYCFVALDGAVSLFLCPLYWDIGLYVPKLKILRCLSFPYGLYAILEEPVWILVLVIFSAVCFHGWKEYRKRFL